MIAKYEPTRKTGTVPSESSCVSATRPTEAERRRKPREDERAWTVPSLPDPDSPGTHFIVQNRRGDYREVWADSKYPW